MSESRIGKKYNRLEVIEEIDKEYVLAKCDCGVLKKIRFFNIKYGKVKSCGCLRKESAKTHGMWRTPTHQSWAKMKDRCNNPKDLHYENYGGAGITYTQDWELFENFLRDMGIRPEGTSLDRIDPYGNYEPENCRWLEKKKQTRNQKISKNNKSGVTGVSKTIKNGKDHWVAQWIDLEGNSKVASFSVSKYGDEVAFNLACDARKIAIEELNKLGAGYGEKHGQ